MPPLRPLLLGLAVARRRLRGDPEPADDLRPHGGPPPRGALRRGDPQRRSSARSAAAPAQRKGERICVRASDVPDYGPLIGPSLAAVKGGGDTNNDARDMARALNASAFYVLYQNDEARARGDVAVLRRHADANAWIVANPSWTNAAGVINAMGALLPAWHILRQTDAPTPEDRAAIEAWLRRLARRPTSTPATTTSAPPAAPPT